MALAGPAGGTPTLMPDWEVFCRDDHAARVARHFSFFVRSNRGCTAAYRCPRDKQPQPRGVRMRVFHAYQMLQAGVLQFCEWGDAD
jgi:hypothetical protein